MNGVPPAQNECERKDEPPPITGAKTTIDQELHAESTQAPPTPISSTEPRQSISTPKIIPIKHWLVVNDSSGCHQEPWKGSSFQQLKIDSLFTEAAAHPLDKEILSFRCSISSHFPQPGFMGRRNLVVGPEDLEALEDAKEEFQIAYEDGLKRGVSKFKILLEPIYSA